MRLFLLFGLLAYLFLLSSCKKFQPADPAFFVRPGNINVSTTLNEGTGSHKITDLFWYVNGKFSGVYPLGSLMPVISNNESATINVFAGIKNNGISDTRIPYPFFDFLTVDTLVESGKTISRGFTFKYKTATTFAWKENFDSPSGFSIKNNKSDTKFRRCTPAESFEGGSIVMSLSGDSIVSRIESSSDGFDLPSASGNVYFELNYKCNTAFTIGLIGTDGTEVPAIIINPQENWNKIYVQLSTAVNTLLSTKYKVYIEFVKDPSESETKQVFLDNLKLLYI